MLEAVPFDVYWYHRNILIFYLGVIGLHLVNSGPDMLLLLLKALISISAPSSPVSNPHAHKGFFRCPHRCLSALPWPQANSCRYVRKDWPEHKSGHRWGPVHRLGWDAGAARAVIMRRGWDSVYSPPGECTVTSPLIHKVVSRSSA